MRAERIDSPEPERGRSGDGPVTVVVSRLVKAGHERDYEAWLAGIQEATRGFEGYLGVSTVLPSGPEKEYVSVFRFGSVERLRAWERSELRRDWLARFPFDAVEGEARTRTLEGLEFWFTAPGAPIAVAPSRHRMTLVICVIVYALTLVLARGLGALLGDVPLAVRAVPSVVIQVVLMTYVIMPWVTRTFERWLFPKKTGGNA